MATVTHKAVGSTEPAGSTSADAAFAPAGARLLIFGGIALIACGMLFGDIFAVFVLHQNGRETGEALLVATRAVSAGNVSAVKDVFGSIGGLLEDRGTKVDTHVHMTDAGYLALLLALLQPYIALSPQRKNFLAKLFVAGGVLLPAGIFLIHYVGLAYSPFPVIGWGSVLADSAGALLIAALIGQAWGLWNWLRRGASVGEPELPPDRTWERRMLLTGGTILVLLGFLYGAWYAGIDLYAHEAGETQILKTMLDGATSSHGGSAVAVGDYGSLAAERADLMPYHAMRIVANDRNRFWPMVSKKPGFWVSKGLMAWKMYCR